MVAGVVGQTMIKGALTGVVPMGPVQTPYIPGIVPCKRLIQHFKKLPSP